MTTDEMNNKFCLCSFTKIYLVMKKDFIKVAFRIFRDNCLGSLFY